MNRNSDPSVSRYRRHIAFEPFGAEGQARLGRSTVLIVGCGALGSSAANLLVRAGVGRLVLLDPDTVALDNLHRQILFDENDAREKRFKVDAAAGKLRPANSEVVIEPLQERFEPETASALFDAYGFALILDGTDNFPTRLAMNAAAFRLGVPFVTAGIGGACGQVLTLLPGRTPCLACVLGQENVTQKSATETAILSPVVQLIAALEVVEAMKILAGHPEAGNGSLWHVDIWRNRFHEMPLEGFRDPGCPICAKKF